MADKLYRQEWEDAIHDAAVSAAAEWRKYVTDNGYEVTDAGEQNAYEKIFAKLMQEYPYESVKNDDMLKLMNIPSDRIWKWSLAGGNDPRIKQREENLEKFLPLVMGAAQPGQDWVNMGSDALKLIAAEKYGYDYTKEGFGKFLKKMGEAQEDFDRAQVNREMREQPLGIPGTNIEFGPKGSAYILGSLTSPSATKAIDNAVATGGDLTAGQAAALTGLDVGTNTAMFAVPSASIFKSAPFLNGLLNSGLQAGAEGVRQYAAPLIDGNLVADPTQIGIAGAAGATRPFIVGAFQGATARVPGRQAMQFSRGVGKATRAGNPAMQERDNLYSQVLEYNKMLQNGELKAGERVVNLAEENKLKGAFAFREKMNRLGIQPTKNGTYKAEDVLKVYDRQPVRLVTITEEGVAPSDNVVKVGENQVLLTPEKTRIYEQLFGAKIADEAEKTPFMKLGINAGRILGDFGGRVEPVIKTVRPSAFMQIPDDYKNTAWYAKLTPEQKKLYDEAMKKKAEEE